jgi:hypothetical protein
MIIDFHTHIFPPDVRERREDYVARDPTFEEMYKSPKAKIATAEDLIRAMDDPPVDLSVALGFAWQHHDDIVRHNDYLLDAATHSGRLIPFTAINMADERAEAEIARCAAAGARGLGELRPENQGWALNGEAGDRLAAAAREHDLILLFHVTEEGGHEYPGKRGCALASFREFARKHADLKIVGAHLGGGIYQTQAPPDIFVDTAAMPLLYTHGGKLDFRGMFDAFKSVPANRLLIGSDYPLVDVGSVVAPIASELSPDSDRVKAALRHNAMALLSLPARAGL